MKHNQKNNSKKSSYLPIDKKFKDQIPLAPVSDNI